MKLLISSVVCLLLCMPALAQIEFQAYLLDAETGEPIPSASISYDGLGAISDQNGKVDLVLSDFPVMISISHLSYHPQQLLIHSKFESGRQIKMIPKTVDIEEVQVTGDRLTRFFENEYRYVSDYLLLNEGVLSIGYESGRLLKGTMTLSDENSKVIDNLPITRPTKLFQDGFGNVHLFAGDSVYQVFLQNDQLQLLYPTALEKFPIDLLNYQFQLGNGFIFKNISGEGQANEYYVIDTLSKNRVELQTVYQEELFSVAEAAVRYRQWHPRLRGKVGWRTDATNDLFEVYVYDLLLRHFPVHSQVFRAKNELLLFDLVNYSIHHYDERFVRNKKLKAHFPVHHQRERQIVQDPVTEKLYWISYQGSRAMLGEIDSSTGRIMGQIETPSLPFIDNIQIRNGEIWFLYQPRLGETTQSLFRMR